LVLRVTSREGASCKHDTRGPLCKINVETSPVPGSVTLGGVWHVQPIVPLTPEFFPHSFCNFIVCYATHAPRLLLSPGAGRYRSSYRSRSVRVELQPVFFFSYNLIPVPCSEYSQPVEVQDAIKAIFEERTKFVQKSLLSFALFMNLFFFRQSDHDLPHDEINIHLISDEGQQAVLSQLDGSAIKALVPLDSSQGETFPEVQRLRDMLGGSKHLNDIEGASVAELTDDVEVPALPTEDLHPSGLTSSTVSSPWEAARVLTGFSLASLLAVYTLISVAAVLFAFYFIRGFLHLGQDQGEKQLLRPADVESGDVDEKGTITQEKVAGESRTPDPPIGVLVDIDAEASTASEEVEDASNNKSSTRISRSLVLSLNTNPWLVPLPPSPPPSPLLLAVQLHDDVTTGGNPYPMRAMVAFEEQPGTDARNTNAAAAVVDVALAMQLRTGFGMTADGAWLVRFVMAVFGWVTILLGRGGERQDGGRRMLGW
jgi:hypothetical protein